MSKIYEIFKNTGNLFRSISGWAWVWGISPSLVAFIGSLYNQLNFTLAFILSFIVFCFSMMTLRTISDFFYDLNSKPIPLINIIRQAEKRGWKIRHRGSLEVLDFILALRQAGLHGDIIFYGQPDVNMFEELTRNSPKQKIPSTHWEEFDINWSAAVVFDNENLNYEISGYENDNFPVGSYSRRAGNYDASINNPNPRYKNLHVTGANSKWFRAAKKEFAGLRRKNKEAMFNRVD